MLPSQALDQAVKSGIFYVVATPIGNLGDITIRAKEVLSSVDLILAEDTRNTLKLLRAYEISPPEILRFDTHIEYANILKIKEKLLLGQSIALVSDAGTPCVSDPGSLIVAELLMEDFKVVPLPGASAFMSHISVSGLNCDSIVFRGFFPRDSKALQLELKKISKFNEIDGCTFFWFESPRRILETVKNLCLHFDNAMLSLIKEISKVHEKVFYGKIKDVYIQLQQEIDLIGEKGEWSIALQPFIEPSLKDENQTVRTPLYWEEALKMLLNLDISVSVASKQISQYFQVSKKDVYAHALRISQKKN